MITKYIQYLRHVRGYSQETCTAYERDVRAFAKFMRENDQYARWSTIDREDIDAYIISLSEAGKKATTTNRALSAISSLYNFFQREGLTKENPCKYESRRKVGESIPNTIPVNELRLAYINAHGATKTMIGILATTGIRLQEMLDLEWQDINTEDCTIKIHGKGQKERLVKTTEDVLTDLKQAKENLNPTGRIFYLSQRDARYMIYKALRPYSNARQLSPHAIRHTLATELARQGENVAVIGKILGHAHIETSQKYIDLSQVGSARPGIMLNQNKQS